MFIFQFRALGKSFLPLSREPFSPLSGEAAAVVKQEKLLLGA